MGCERLHQRLVAVRRRGFQQPLALGLGWASAEEQAHMGCEKRAGEQAHMEHMVAEATWKVVEAHIVGKMVAGALRRWAGMDSLLQLVEALGRAMACSG
jgi:hypothetical protein